MADRQKGGPSGDPDVGGDPKNMHWFHPTKKHSERERWICLYPVYINSAKTLAEGRRIPKEKGIENPTPQELRDVLATANLNIGVEAKWYPRELSHDNVTRGRIRVQLRNDDGTPANPDFPSRNSVLLYAAEMIPKLKTRQQKGSDTGQTQQAGNKKKSRRR